MSDQKQHETKEKTYDLQRYLESPLLVISALVLILAVVKNIIPSGDIGTIGLGFGTMSFYFAGILILGLLSLVYASFQLSKEEKEYKVILIPIFIFSTLLFVWQADQIAAQGNVFTARSYNTIAIVFGLFSFLFTIGYYRIMKLSTAMVTAIFLSTLVTHVIPAHSIKGIGWTGEYLEALDPYYYYRHANTVFNTGHLPGQEGLTYPTNPPDFSNKPLLSSLFLGAMGLLLQPMGISVHDLSMVYAGVFAAFTSVVLYLLVKELFADFAPYHKIAAVLAAFMLIFNPAFAAKAMATNAEDDAMGMFLLVSSFYLFMLSFRRKNLKLSVLTGLSFLTLHLTWNGFKFSLLVFSVFAFAYPLTNFLRDMYNYFVNAKRELTKSYLTLLPYYVIPFILAHTAFLFLHQQGAIPMLDITNIAKYNRIAFGAVIFSSFLFEAIRIRLTGKLEFDTSRLHGKMLENLEKYSYHITGALILAALAYVVIVMNPVAIIKYFFFMLEGARTEGIISQTTAEQNPLCGNKWSVGCIKNLYNTFGVVALYALFTVFLLGYYALTSEKNIGPIFVLGWSLPIIWGVINKSQYQYAASIPFVVLGSALALFIVIKRKDFETLRIIPTIILIVTPAILIFTSPTPLVGPFGGTQPIERGTAVGDIKFWNPTLQWIGEQPKDTTILTWWDYGHWITAISNRTSVADNTKKRSDIVQDLARFHVLEENESEALDIAKKYNSTHVVIDYTMISKSGAPHFIATSNLSAPMGSPDREGSHMGYGLCRFSPKNSQLKEQWVSTGGGDLKKKRTVVFTCNIAGPPDKYIRAIKFEVVNKQVESIKIHPIVKREQGYTIGNEIPWSLWQNKTDASILGVHSFSEILSNCLAKETNPQYFVNFDTYTSLAYVPSKFNNYMITRLYLGEHLQEYKMRGMADESIRPLDHFELVEGFQGGLQSGADNSTLGYVRAWRINYPEN